ncbi:MAG: ATP-binding protein, partial [Planctomycetota bacterium JB042]
PSEVLGDVTRLRQVIVNLLSNAVKFTDEGEVVLTARRLDDGGPECVLEFVVADTGIGIPEDRRSALFDPFTQAEASTTRRFGGTGLGLAISARLVRQMGGTIEVDSRPGEGAAFRFTIRAAMPAKRFEPAPEDRRPLEGRRALVLLENPRELDVFVRRLRGFGLSVFGRRSAAWARSVLSRGERFDVAFLDERVEDAERRPALEIVRAEAPDLPIVRLASLGSPSLGRQPCGVARTTLVRPVKSWRLRQLLLDLFDDAAAAESRAARTEEVPAELPPLKILVAEDNPVNRRVAVKTLERLGCTADCVEDGQQAVDAVAREEYDLVLMDVQMPVLDGLEATRRIRASREDGRPTIVALTADALAEHRTQCLAAGMDGHLSKPFRVEDLRALLGSLAANAP